MRNDQSRSESAVSFKLGRWAEARATGWGVAALVALCALLAAVVVMGGALPR
jgi:hypothetical protein